MFFFGIEREGRLKDSTVFVESLLASALGIGTGLVLFPAEASLIGVFLLVFAQFRTVEALLDRNRDQVYGGQISPGRANLLLAQSLLLLFAGVFFTYVIAVQLAPVERLDQWFDRQLGDFVGGSIADVEFDHFGELVRRNSAVLLIGFLFALVYRHGGMLLVLAWNASRWGVIFSYVARRAAEDETVQVAPYLARTMACILPHLICEATAYVLGAMSGVFLSKGLEKYALSSEAFRRVAWASTRLAVMGLCTVVIAASLEAFVAPHLVHLLFRGP